LDLTLSRLFSPPVAQAYKVVRRLERSLQHHLAAAATYAPEVQAQLQAIAAEMAKNQPQHQQIIKEKKEVRALMRELRNEDGIVGPSLTRERDKRHDRADSACVRVRA
jgi:glutaredoxin 2